MHVACSDQVGLFDVVEQELVLPVGVAKTVVPLAGLGDRRGFLSQHAQQARLPESDVVPEHPRLHFRELPGIGQHARGEVHERAGDSELVAGGDPVVAGLALEKLPHEAAGALRDLCEYFRALGGIG